MGVAVVSRAPARPDWRLFALLLSAEVPVLVSWTTSQSGPAALGAMAASLVAAVVAWVRWRGWHWRDAVLVSAFAIVVAMSHPILGVWALVGGLAAAALLRAGGWHMPWLSWGRRAPSRGLLIGVATGLVLGLINLSLPGASPRGGTLHGLSDALRAGICEELGMRACLLAASLFLLKRWPSTRKSWFLVFLIVIVPHASMHFVGAPMGDLLTGTIVLGLLFGLPLSVVLIRYGVIPAIVCHALIDALRVTVVGF